MKSNTINSTKILFLLLSILMLMGSCKEAKKSEEKMNTDTATTTQTTEPFFKLSLAQWSFHKAIRDDKTLSNLDFAKKAKELGFEGIEYVSQLYPLAEGKEQESLDSLVIELKKRSEEHNIQNVLIMIDHEGDLSVSDKAERDEAIRRHSMWVNAAAELGCCRKRS